MPTFHVSFGAESSIHLHAFKVLQSIFIHPNNSKNRLKTGSQETLTKKQLLSQETFTKTLNY